MAMTLEDELLELEIQQQKVLMQIRQRDGEIFLAREHCERMKELISQRSPEVVRQMEQEKGLA